MSAENEIFLKNEWSKDSWKISGLVSAWIFQMKFISVRSVFFHPMFFLQRITGKLLKYLAIITRKLGGHYKIQEIILHEALMTRQLWLFRVSEKATTLLKSHQNSCTYRYKLWNVFVCLFFCLDGMYLLCNIFYHECTKKYQFHWLERSTYFQYFFREDIKYR